MIEHEYAARYAQRLVFRALRSLEDSDRPPGSKWTVDALERTFRRVRQRRLYRHARRAFAAFLQSVGRLAPPSDNGPHASVLAAYQRFLSEVRGLAPTTIANHLAEVGAVLRHALPEGERLKRLTADAIEQYIERRARAVSRASCAQRWAICVHSCLIVSSVDGSKLVVEVANLSPRFNAFRVPTDDRIRQLRHFAEEYAPLRSLCEQEPDLVLVGTLSLSVIDKAA